MSALSLAVYEQFQRTQITIDVEGHGRFDPLERIDLSATIGWFSAIYPVMLTCSPDSGSENELIDQTIKATKEKLRQVSHGGIAYGILSQAGQGKHQGGGLSQSRILFNYLGGAGRTEPDQPDVYDLTEIDIEIPGQRHPANQRAHFIEILACFHHRQFHVQWHYDKDLLDPGELAEFVRCYERILQKMILQLPRSATRRIHTL